MRKVLFLLLTLLLSLSATAQDIFTEANSNKWLVLPPNQQQEQQFGIKLPTAYFYNIPTKARVELFDNAETPDMVQINALEGSFDYYQDNYTSVTKITVIYYNNDSVKVSGETLELERNSNNAGQIMSKWLDKHDVQPLIDYLMHSKGFVRIIMPILGKGSMTVEIPCIEGKIALVNK